MSQAESVAVFRKLHSRRPLVLPNAWDAASAKAIEAAGAPAIATTSAGVSWSHGRSDGQSLGRHEMFSAILNVVNTVKIPVTADIESGYGQGSDDDVAETVRRMISIGVAGINIEDTPGHDGEVLLSPEEQANRIRAARETATALGADLFINARIDVYLFQVGEPESRFEAVVERATLYSRAGSDGIFVPGVIDADTIERLAKAINAPLNIMAMPGAPSIAELGRLGVARVSVGPAIAQVAFAAAKRAAHEMLEQGTFTSLESGTPFHEVNSMFA